MAQVGLRPNACNAHPASAEPGGTCVGLLRLCLGCRATLRVLQYNLTALPCVISVISSARVVYLTVVRVRNTILVFYKATLYLINPPGL